MSPAGSRYSKKDRPEDNPDRILEVCCPSCLRQYRIAAPASRRRHRPFTARNAATRSRFIVGPDARRHRADARTPGRNHSRRDFGWI